MSTGRVRLLTAEEMKTILAIPVYYIFRKQAQISFPESSTPGPSSFVMIIRTGNQVPQEHWSAFPVYVNWRQWNEVVAPILEDGRWVAWLGQLGLTSTTIAPPPPTPIPDQGLYNDLTTYYIDLLGDEMSGIAITLGYGPPTW